MDIAVAQPTEGLGALQRLEDAVKAGIAPALAIMLDDALFARVQKIAEVMSKAVGFVPAHCVNKTEVCFAIVTRALVWRLDPFSVCQSTYQPVEPSERNPSGGKIAYEAKLVQAILEQSGRLDGPITREYHGDWSKVQGKFRMQINEKTGKKYPKESWPDEAETGLSITVSALLKGERERRSVELDLRQCHPRNSTLWSVDPKTQIYYRAVRMLGNVAMPGVLMGVPFVGEVDDDEDSRASRARNVTPVDVSVRAAAPPEEIVVIDPDGEELSLLPGELEAKAVEWCRESTDEQLAQLAENNLHVGAIRDAVESEALRRASTKPEHGDDPLHILGMKGALAFLAALRLGIEQADKLDADRYWQCYRERAHAAETKVGAGDYASIEALVTDKITGITGA